jgi:hypothetical protein
VDLVALVGPLVASAGLAGVGVRRVTGRRRTWAAVEGGSRRDFFGDRVEAAQPTELRAAEPPLRRAA